jgi:hypothetical protein
MACLPLVAQQAKQRLFVAIGTAWFAACLPGIVLAALPLTRAAEARTGKPDILFIAIDDMNDWTTLFDRNNPIKTPNLERLVATIEASFPQPTQMDRYFAYSVDLFQISVPKRLETELVNLGDQQGIVSARQQAADQARRQITAGVDRFVQDCVASLREQTATLCQEMLESMRDGKSGVHQRP